MIEFLGRNNIRVDTGREMSPEQVKAAEKLLKGVLIVPTHMGKEKKYKVNRLERPASQYEFNLVDHTHKAAEGGDSQPPSRRLTVAQYFKETYQALRSPQWPCVSVGDPKKPICFPFEVCRIARGVRYNRKLNPKQQTNIAKVNCLTLKQLI